MKQLLLSFFAISGLAVNAQYCMTAGPSQTADSNLESLTLNGASGSINYTGCPGVTGVQQYLAQTVYLNAGGNYTVNLQFGTCNGNYSGVGEAWIDFNLNGIFEPSESIGTWQGIPPTAPSAFNFTVPGGANNGQTRMRVIQREAGTLPIDPCGAFTWGSACDFSIVIQNGIDCSGYVGDDETDPRVVSTLPFSESHSTALCYTNQNPVYGSPDVYYLVLPGANTAALDISLCGSSFDTFLSAFDTDWNALGINDDSPSCGMQSELQVDVTGMDSVWVIVEGWGTSSGSYDIAINEQSLGLKDISETGVYLFPNPASGKFSVKGLNEGNITLTDARGAVVLEAEVTNGKSYDISGYESGVYYATVKSQSVSQIFKLVIK